MNILITGGTGFLGSALTHTLITQGHQVTVISRHPQSVEQHCGTGVNAVASLAQLPTTAHYDVMINLAGAPIFASRWTTARKQLLRDSRLNSTQQLVDYIAQLPVKPALLISGSAIGYYGDQGDNILTEQSVTRADFSQQLCADWEAIAQQAEQFGVRVCLIRTGLVIANGGGLLQQMLLPFRLGLGGRLGNGQQWMSWIHRHDWLNIALAMMSDTTMHGAYNATAPTPVTNNEFTQTLAKLLKRPALLPLPAWLLTPLLGEMSALVLGSQRVLPDRLLAQGFRFHYQDLSSAITQALTDDHH